MLSGCIVPPFPVAHVERVPTGLRLEQSNSASCVRPDLAAVASDPKRADAAMLSEASGLLAIRDTRGPRCERASGKNSITDARRVALGGPAMTLTTVFRRFREAGGISVACPWHEAAPANCGITRPEMGLGSPAILINARESPHGRPRIAASPAIRHRRQRPSHRRPPRPVR